MPGAKGSLLDRIADKFTVGDDCWEWTGAQTQGYGYITSGRRDEPLMRAHRVLYELLVGPIPEGFELDHLCRNPGCVRPAHLEPVTHKENMRRGFFGTKTHCAKGHEFTPTNTMPTKSGGRKCRECNREWCRIGHLKRKGVA